MLPDDNNVYHLVTLSLEDPGGKMVFHRHILMTHTGYQPYGIHTDEVEVTWQILLVNRKLFIVFNK